MNKFLKVSCLASALVSACVLLPGVALAEEGRVISSTPVLKRVTEPKSTCIDDANGKQRCTTKMVTEDRQVGYRVVYEYAGKQHTAQLPFAPGATIPLEVTPTAASAQPVSASQPQPLYVTEAPPVIERVVREEVYVDSYYPRPYYAYGYPYYYSPFVPVLGVSLAFGGGHYRGGFGGHGGHWHR